MNPKRTIKKPILQAFREFHLKNPKVYILFEAQALGAIAKGRKKIGAKSIMEWIRWELYHNITKGSFKLNNNFTSYYVRIFIRHHPQHADKFEIRRLRSYEAFQAKMFA